VDFGGLFPKSINKTVFCCTLLVAYYFPFDLCQVLMDVKFSNK
jgi:hypothetical protein